MPAAAPMKPSMAARRRAMMAAAARPAMNPNMMKKGGKAEKHEDAAEDRAMIKKAMAGKKFASGGTIQGNVGKFAKTDMATADRTTKTKGTGGVKNGNGGGYATGGTIAGNEGKFSKTKVVDGDKNDSVKGTGKGVKLGNGGGYASGGTTGGVRKGNAGGYMEGGSAKKAYATGGKVDSGKAQAMPKKPVSRPVANSLQSGTFKRGGKVARYADGGSLAMSGTAPQEQGGAIPTSSSAGYGGIGGSTIGGSFGAPTSDPYSAYKASLPTTGGLDVNTKPQMPMSQMQATQQGLQRLGDGQISSAPPPPLTPAEQQQMLQNLQLGMQQSQMQPQSPMQQAAQQAQQPSRLVQQLQQRPIGSGLLPNMGGKKPGMGGMGPRMGNMGPGMGGRGPSVLPRFAPGHQAIPPTPPPMYMYKRGGKVSKFSDGDLVDASKGAFDRRLDNDEDMPLAKTIRSIPSRLYEGAKSLAGISKDAGAGRGFVNPKSITKTEKSVTVEPRKRGGRC